MFRIVILAFLVILLGSCGINSNLMFKTPKGVEEQTDSIPLRPAMEYTISKDDKFRFNLYTNSGSEIILNMSGVSRNSMGAEAQQEYLVRQDGTAEIPVKGIIKVAGLTVQQLEDTISSLFYREYNKTFVQVTLTNQRVIVFPGSGGDARVIPLQNTNTTLMEAIALAGGVADRGRADKIKLLRIVGNKRVMYVLDLSTIDGLKYADMIVQANDYIYIEPNEQLGREIVSSAAPIISLISSALIILTVLLSNK